jgi:transposase
VADASPQGELFPAAEAPADGVAVINDRCVLRTDGDHRVVVGAGVVLHHFGVGDRMAEAHAMVSLVEQGWADQNDVACAFGRSARTLRRHLRRYEEDGMAGLGRAVGYPRGRPRSPAQDRTVGRLKAEGASQAAIAHRLGVTERAVRKRLRRLGWKPEAVEQVPLPFTTALPPSVPGEDPNLSAFPPPPSVPGEDPNLSAFPPPPSVPGEDPNLSAFPPPPSVPGEDPNLSAFPPPVVAPATLDRDPANRSLDRLLAYLGLLDDAEPIFRPGSQVAGAGVLLALPSLVASGLLDAARQVYGSIGPAFYGLRTTLVTLLFMALLRIQRPEALKERSPLDLGRVLGLDRSPEVKTVRRKLTRLARLGGADQLGQHLARLRVAQRGDAMGFLYVDGHVRVYYGKRELPKTHVARIRLAMPATTDYWVNDRAGDPLLVLTAEANAGLAKVLPEVLANIRTLVGERRVTVVFDRGGWSPRLFANIIAQGFDILTYRKGRSRRVPRRRFREHVGTIDGREVRYLLADQGIRLLGGLRLRQVTRLKDGHQTPIVTSRRDLAAVEVAQRMFDRWRQENFFKYLREEYLLDALVDYQVEPDDPARDVPNPAWADADARLREAREKIARLRATYGGAALANPEKARPTMRGFKIAHGKLGRQIRAAARRVLALEEKRSRIPRRIPVGERAEGPVIKLAGERKHLTNLLKMIAYQAESDLVAALAPHYKRVDDEGRTLVQTALASAADIAVADGELRVTLAPLSSPHRSRAVDELCRQMNATVTTFPGTKLFLRYAVAGLGEDG